MSVGGFAQAPAPSWSQWRGPARDGVASSFTAPAAWPAQLTKRWQATVGLGHSSPVIAGNRVVVHTRRNNGEIVAAYDFQSGKLLWQDGVDAPYTMNPAATGHGPGPKSTPAIADGRVFTLGISGIFSAHDLATGKLLQIITQSQNKLVGIDAASGQLLWEVPVKTPFEQNSVTPLVIGELVLYAGLEHPTVAMRVTRSGAKWITAPAWSNDQVSMYMSTPAVAGGAVYGLSNKNRGQFFAIDAATGRTLWTTKGREAENASIVRAGEYLLMATTNSELVIAQANPARYDEVRRYTVADSAMWAHPAFSGRTIVVKDVNTLTVWGF